jgi:hypothetical protein
VLLRIEHHHDRVANPGLGVADGAVVHDDTGDLLRAERLPHEI